MSKLELPNILEEQTFVITLKEILDVINNERKEQGINLLEHSKSMKKVESLAKEISFGLVDKIASKQKTGFGFRELETYLLNKKQAIVVGARLDNKRLMLLMNKVEELENQKALFLQEVEKFLPKGGFLEENKNGLLRTKAVRGYWRVDKFSEASIILQEKYELQKRLNGLMQDEIKKEIEIRDMKLCKLLEAQI